MQPRNAGCGRPAWLALLIGSVLSSVASAAEPAEFHHENVLGTSLEIQVATDSSATADRAEKVVLDEIARLAAIVGTYSEQSEFSQLLRGPKEPRKVSAELLEILQLSDRWMATSERAYHPSVEVLTQLWEKAAKENRAPTPEEIKHAVESLGPELWKIDAAAGTVERRTDVPVNLNALAKGFIIDRVCAAVQSGVPGVKGLLVDIGGDMRVVGDMTRTVGIMNPRQPADNAPPLVTIRLRDKAVATSGGYRRGFDIDGKHYSHIFDPRTGQPVDRILSATAVAPTAAQADVLATILNVMEPEAGLKLVNATDDTECLLVTADGKQLASDGWQQLVQPGSAEPPAIAGGHELVVNFTLGSASARRYRRPYVAVWVEDEKGTPVRTLCLWIERNGRYVRDLRQWYRLEGRNTQLINAVSSATRPAGEYRLVWDGRDNDGKELPKGKYRLVLEVVREGGAYQIIREEVVLDDEPFQKELQGNTEVRAASLEYRHVEGPADSP